MSDIPQIRSRHVFRPTACERKYLMDYKLNILKITEQENK